MRGLRTTVICITGLTGSCTFDSPAMSGALSGPAGEPMTAGDEGPDDGDDGSAGTSDGAGDGDGPRLDVSPPGPPEQMPCTKVDFLFLIDSSGSMQTHQENLAASFGGFMDAALATLDMADDFHVMVIDSDDNAAATCDWWCDVGSPFCPYECYASQDPMIWQDCDRSFGAGVRYPLGLHSSGVDCGIPDGRRYLTSTDTDLHDKFACIAQVGASHTDEWQMDSLTAAMGPAHNTPGGCNEGFLRDDAILVLTIITDEPDTESAGTVAQWHDAVVAAKGGNEDSVVVLGLISDRGLPGAVCTNTSGFPSESPNMHELVDTFVNHGKGSICLDDFVPFFQEQVGLIDVVCDNFVPAG